MFAIRDGADTVVDLSGTGMVLRILLATDGSITHILEAYAGEAVDLVRLSSSTAAPSADLTHLGVADDERVLRRVCLLQGRESGHAFVHAESVVMLDRLPEPVATGLFTTDTTLLKLLSQNRVGTFRECLAEWQASDGQIAGHLGMGSDATLIGRTYRIVVGGRPVAWISESFPKLGFSDPPSVPRPAQATPTLGRRRAT